MRTIHRLVIYDRLINAFAKAGFPVNAGDVIFVGEDEERWPTVKSLIASLKMADVPFTEYTSLEIERAHFHNIHSTGHFGYPQPEDDFKYLNVTYDATHYCSVCGSGARQVAPFRLRKQPSQAQRALVQLNWVFDEFFVSRENWQKIFEPFGISFLPVLHWKSLTEFDSDRADCCNRICRFGYEGSRV